MNTNSNNIEHQDIEEAKEKIEGVEFSKFENHNYNHNSKNHQQIKDNDEYNNNESKNINKNEELIFIMNWI